MIKRSLFSAVLVAMSPTLAWAVAVSFQFDDVSDVPPASGSVDLKITTDTALDLDISDIDIDITPPVGGDLTKVQFDGTVTSPGSPWDFSLSLDTTNADTGDYYLAAADWVASGALVGVGTSTLFTLDWDMLAGAPVGDYTVTMSVDLLDDYNLGDITGSVSVSSSTITVAPEPSGLTLALLVVPLFALWRRRK